MRTSLVTTRRRAIASALGIVAAGLLGVASALAVHGVAPISVDPAAAMGNDSSLYADMTPDGRFVAFVSAASNLVPGDTNTVGDVFVRDRRTGVTERVSVGIKGNEGDGDSNYLGIATNPSISDDGRYVAFKSEATNLVRGDRNAATDVFVRDRVAGTTERISVDSAGNEAPGGGDDPAISPDGRYVAFVTFDFDANFSADIYLRDRIAATTQRISVAHDGGETQNNSYSPVVGLGSGGAAIVAFGSFADNLVPNDVSSGSDVFVRDLSGPTPTTEWISVTSDEQPPALFSDSGEPAITGDGRYVAFSSNAGNFATPAQTGLPFTDIFVRDRQAGTTVLASPDSLGGEADSDSQNPDISPDGRFVSFASFATDLVAGRSDSDFLILDAFVRDTAAGGSTKLVSVASDHSDATMGGLDTHVDSGPVSDDGLVSVITTGADNLVAGDPLYSDVFAVDFRPGTDLSLVVTDTPDPVASRGTLTYTLVATNNGLSPAPATGILDNLSADVRFVSASAGCTHIQGTVDCVIGTLQPGASTTVEIVVTPRRTGIITNTATVASVVADPTPGNNTGTIDTTVAK
jgi:uncharacterized repeat protein (TIGR01451 family)